MIIGAIDIGGAHPWPGGSSSLLGGQVVGTAVIESSRTIVWPRGGVVEQQDVVFWVQAWQALGGSAAGSFQALLYLLRQLEELASNTDLQAVYVQWATTAQPNPPYNAPDPHDGWYVIEKIRPDYASAPSGFVAVSATMDKLAPTPPASLATWYAGAALATTYTATATPLIAFPIGASGAPGTTGSRTGAEGVVPYTINPLTNAMNPVGWVRPGTIAALYTGQAHVYDTVSTSSNPIPLSGSFVNTNWVEVFGTQHDLVGDYVITNGLLLLLFQVGQVAAPTLYFWNTSLGTPAWQQALTLNYKDSPSFNIGTAREVNLERVGLEEVRLRVRLSSSAGQWAQLRFKLQRGMRHASVEFLPLTETNAQAFGLDILGAATPKIAYNEAAIADASSSANLAASTVNGFGAAFGTGTNGPIYGWLYQNPPATGQPSIGGSADIGFGDGATPTVGTYQLYGVFATPWTAAQNLQAEAESGNLGGGWTSVVDAAASGGHAAKAASGTASGNADLFGTSYVPQVAQYDMWVRLKVTSAASSTAQMQIGLWDVTSAGFVASTTLAPNQASTSYVWIRVVANTFPTASHNMQFRAVTTATLGTDWFIDEAALVPKISQAQGVGDAPGDLFTEFLFDADRSWAHG